MKSTSQSNPTPSGVLGVVTKLIRLTEKKDVEWFHWQYPTNNVTARRNLAKYLKNGCPKINRNGEVITKQLSEGHELARLILGDDFITPEEMASFYGMSYTEDQLKHFGDTLPHEVTLQWYQTQGYMLVAGPSRELNLHEVQGLNNKLFYPDPKEWYAESRQKFARRDTVACGEWLAIRKEEVPSSFRKTWWEQWHLVTEGEYVPNAAEVSYAVTAYYEVRGIRLLHDKYVRTNSISAHDNHVVVGGKLSLIVDECHNDYRRNSLGVASARRIES